MATDPTPQANPAVVSTRQGYELWANVYDDEDNPLIALETVYLGPQLTDVRNLDVADIGCGTGRVAIGLAAAGARVTALDFSPAMLAKARRKPGAAAVQFIVHDLEKPLPLASAAFDLVTCCLVLDHIANLTGLFGEMRRLCRRTGRILVSVMHPAMMLRGVQARFTDPATGQEVRPASVANQICDYVLAASRAGLVFEHISEHAVDEALAARSPRAHKYLGWPLLLLMRLHPGSAPPTVAPAVSSGPFGQPHS